MSNLIQIKRSNTSSSPTTTLNSGELAYSYNSNTLYVGAQTGIGATAIKISGNKYGYIDQVVSPGILTSNAAVIVDANSFISNVYSQGLFLHNSIGTISINSSASFVNSISSQANSSQLGSINSAGSNNELATTGAITTYVQAQVINATTPAGSNQQFQYNNSGVIGGTSNFLYDNSTGVATVGNSSVFLQLGYLPGVLSTQHNHGNVNNYVQLIMNNANNGSAASSDFAAYNDQGINSTTFVDMGINSSLWSNTLWTINGPNDGYLYTGNGSLTIGSNLAAGYVNFFAGGTLASNEKLRIGTSTITIANSVSLTANGSAGSLGQVLTSNGSGVYWSAAGTGSVNAAQQIAWSNTQSFSNTITFNGPILANTVNATSVNIGASVTINNANLYAPAVYAQFADLSVSGNLTVSGVVTTINTQQLTVIDNIIELASNNQTDSVDTGWYSPANTGGTINYSGFGRIAALSSATNPYFKLFTSTSNPNTSTTFTTTSTGTLQAFLAPYGAGGVFIANTSNVQITANSTVGVNFAANSLTLTTALLATYGGTGVNTYATGDILYAGGANPTALSKLSIPGSAANGQLLMITNNLPAYGTLDGGTF